MSILSEDRLADDHFEIAVVLVQSAHANFEVLVEFLAVVGLGEDRDIREIQGNGVGAVVAHGANQLAVAERVIAGEFDVADLDLGAFFNLEHQDHGIAGGDALVLRRDFGELTAVLAEQVFAGRLRPS